MKHSPHIQNYRRIGTITIFAVYFLILVGGIVRASGAGMGCPDWPTCFDRWIPPTMESQLPPNYQEIYAERGYADTRFNAIKTWTEYINRVIGVCIGFLVLLTVIFARPFLNTDKTIFFLSFAVFCLVGFQGWLGAVVVGSNLRPYLITLHMITALFIVAILIYTITRSQKVLVESIDLSNLDKRFRTITIVAMIMTLIQVIMGTQIREAVDVIAVQFNYENREIWREHFPLIFYIHRTFSAVILATNAWLVWNLSKNYSPSNFLSRAGLVLGGLILFAIATGITMDRFGIPAVAQPIHLLLAALIFGTQFFILIVISYALRFHSPGSAITSSLPPEMS